MTLGGIVIEQTLTASIDRIWRAWTESAQAGTWFAAKANIWPERGGAYELFWDPAHPDRDSTLGCRVTFIQPQQWLGFTWRGPSLYDDLMNENASPPPSPTHVTVQFESQGHQTVVRVTHTGWGAGQRWMEARNWHIRAWASVIQNLMPFLEGHELPFNWIKMRLGKLKA
jgi:uncharacterized protein YndB with AHSA1/START domain